MGLEGASHIATNGRGLYHKRLGLSWLSTGREGARYERSYCITREATPATPADGAFSLNLRFI
jgi:hypothetical protein